MLRIPLVLVALLLPAFAAAQEYKVNLSPTYMVGDAFAYSVDCTRTQENEIWLDGNVIKSGKAAFTVKAEGSLAIVAVNPRGDPAEVTLTLRQIALTDVSGMAPTLKAGDVVGCKRDAKAAKTYTLNGAPAAPADQELLDALVSVGSANIPDDQESFGPKKPVKVGDAWDINKQAALVAFAEMGIKDGEKIQVDGRFQLDKVATEKGREYHRVSGWMKLANMAPPMPPGVEVKEGTADVKGTMILPADGVGSRLAETNQMTMRISAAGTVEQQGAKQAIAMRMSRTQKDSKTWKPEAAAPAQASR